MAVVVACASAERTATLPAVVRLDVVSAPGVCVNDSAECPGACNAQGYCEVDGEFGLEVRLPPARYAVDYELRAHEGIMNKGTHTGLVGGFRPPRPPRDGLEDDA